MKSLDFFKFSFGEKLLVAFVFSTKIEWVIDSVVHVDLKDLSVN